MVNGSGKEKKSSVTREEQEEGVRINLISSRKLDSMSSQDKLRFILDQVKRGTVLVLERGLTAVEEIDLIKSTMSEIDHQTFIGIEMQSYSSEDVRAGSWFSKLLGRTKVPRMSVIGPANLLKTIQKDGNMIQAMILTGKSIVKDTSEDSDESEDLADMDERDADDGLDSGDEDSDLDSEAPLAIPVSEPENDDSDSNSYSNSNVSTNENNSDWLSEQKDSTGTENNQEVQKDLKQQTLDYNIYGSPPPITPIATRVWPEDSQEQRENESDKSEDTHKNNNNINNIESSSFLYKRLKQYEEE